jgi:hypothetical protein
MLAEGEGDAGDKCGLSTRICGMLAVHAMIEEEIFSPAARKADVDADRLDQAEIEHGSAKELIAQIGAAQVSEPLYANLTRPATMSQQVSAAACRAAGKLSALLAVQLARQLGLALLQARADLGHVDLKLAADGEELVLLFLDVMPMYSPSTLTRASKPGLPRDAEPPRSAWAKCAQFEKNCASPVSKNLILSQPR